jgi:phosphoglycerate dehydrogenase-like enzyme
MKLLLNSCLRFTDEQRQRLEIVWPGLEILERFVANPDELEGDGVNVLVSEAVPRNLEKWSDLHWVQLLSAGANQLRDHPISKTKIPVTTASGTHAVPIAQYVTCTWLMMVHRMTSLMDFKSSCVWPDRLALAGTAVRGMTVGVVGYGSIGRECARQLSALGMKVICLKRNPASRSHPGYNAWPGTGDPQGKIPEAWFGPDHLPEMLPQCDLLVVTVPSTPQTEGMIGRAELALLKERARMVIISRGGIVREKALADALKAGQLAEAVVDCYVREPLPPDHFFFQVPNLIMTPHMSGVYDEFWAVMVGLLAENLRRLKSGSPLLNPTDHQAGY